MDHRIALKSGTQLRFCNDDGESIRCVIKSEIGRGGSCIVYEAARTTGTGGQTLYRVKECYPYKLGISRSENNGLIPSDQDEEAFRQSQEQFRDNFSRAIELFYSGDNYAAMTNQLDVFKLNGTSYVLSAYSSELTLETYRPESLKECVTLIKQVAYVLKNIHQQGYLYLDTKPNNILIVGKYPKRIELFDFDSLVALDELSKERRLYSGDIRLAYSKGFAPYELESGKIKHLGPHTDVYGIGALLFYLLFGHTPSASDCEMYATYDFSSMQYDLNLLDDQLLRRLEAFFRQTLAVYYPDRYQHMGDVLTVLEQMERCADPTVPRIFSSKMIKPRIFHGREQEFIKLDQFIKSKACNCLFVTGMGGIGKSTLMRAYLAQHRDQFDTLLYLHYRDNMVATISNDYDIEISTLRQQEEAISDTQYFKRKVQKIRELVRGTSSILVIDNFTGDVDDALLALLKTDLKVVLLSRTASSFQGGDKLEVTAITNQDALRNIFVKNLDRSIDHQEQVYFQEILQHIQGHTLILELIAKQIAKSHLTLARAVQLTREHGFSAMAPEKVYYEKDSRPSIDTIGNILDALFEATALSEDKKVLLKVASLLGDDGIDINQFQHIMTLGFKDDINQLIEDGWLMISGDTLSMHRVIQEAIRRWAWTPQYLEAAEQFLTYFYIEIRLESTKNNYPKRQRDWLSAMKGESFPQTKEQLEGQLEGYFQQGIGGKVYRERYARIEDTSPADMRKLADLLQQSEHILEQCNREAAMQDIDVYASLLFVTVLNTPRYRDEYIADEVFKIFPVLEADEDCCNTTQLTSTVEISAPIQFMQFHDMMVWIHANQQRFEEAERLLEYTGELTQRVDRHDVYALYYESLSTYYDIRLNGAYDGATCDEVYFLEQMLLAIDKTLQYAQEDCQQDGNHLYAKNLLDKATILMRSGRGSEDEIHKLIDTATMVIQETTSQYADVRLQWFLVLAWYHALLKNDAESVEGYIKEACMLSDKIIPTDLRKIEEIIVPAANMFYEVGCYEKALAWLDKGLLLCNKHIHSESYARIKHELWDHLWEVATVGQEFELCQKIIQRIDAENEVVTDTQNRLIISDEVRNTIANKT